MSDELADMEQVLRAIGILLDEEPKAEEDYMRENVTEAAHMLHGARLQALRQMGSILLVGQMREGQATV